MALAAPRRPGAGRANAWSTSLGQALQSTTAVGVVVALGAVARTAQYLAGSSLSGDESFLALNLVSRTYSGLFRQLDYNQVAPQLLLVTEKLGIDVFGRSEWAVRLVPFVAGLAALLFFPLLARRLLPPASVLPAVALVAFSDPLVAWTAANKQYAVDVLATVVVLLVVVSLRDRVAEPRIAAGLATVGAVAVWFSFTSVFVLAGAGVALLTAHVHERRRASLLALGAIGLAWVLSFAVSYSFVRNGVTSLQDSLDHESGAFIAAGDSAGEDAGALAGVVRYVTGVPEVGFRGYDAAELVVILALAFALAGLVAYTRRQPFAATILGLPVVVALLAAAVGAYPLLPRAALWSLPILALLAARGMAAGFERPGWRRAVGIVLALAVIVFTAAPTVGHVVEPRRTQEMRPLLARLATEMTDTDHVFVYYKSQYGLRWYLACCADDDVRRARAEGLLPLRPVRGSPAQWAPALDSAPPRFVVGQEYDAKGRELEDLDGLPRHTRTWVVLSNVPVDKRAELLAALDARGTRLRSIGVDGDEGVARAYLYNLRRGQAR